MADYKVPIRARVAFTSRCPSGLGLESGTSGAHFKVQAVLYVCGVMEHPQTRALHPSTGTIRLRLFHPWPIHCAIYDGFTYACGGGPQNGASDATAERGEQQAMPMVYRAAWGVGQDMIEGICAWCRHLGCSAAPLPSGAVPLPCHRMQCRSPAIGCSAAWKYLISAVLSHAGGSRGLSIPCLIGC